MADPVNTIVNTALTPSISSLGKFKTPFLIVIGILIIGIAVWVFSSWRKNKDKWNVQIRLRQEDTQTKKIYLDPVVIKAKRVTLSNNLRMLYLEKPILGKRLFPLLNYYSKPGVYDIILTADNRIFIIDGIKGIDEQRKVLNVGVRYPGIDYQFDELNTQYAQMNKKDSKNDILEMLKIATIGVVAIVLLIGGIVGGKYYIQSKEIDQRIGEQEVQILATISENQEKMLETTNALNLFISKYEKQNGDNSVSQDLNKLNGST